MNSASNLVQAADQEQPLAGDAMDDDAHTIRTAALRVISTSEAHVFRGVRIDPDDEFAWNGPMKWRHF